VAAKNLASWQYRLGQWYVFFMAILGGWGIDQLSLRRQFKLVTATQGEF
jgi:hypothetical protein